MHERISIRPEVCLGRACLRDTPITVSVVLHNLSVGLTPESVIALYPVLEPEDISAALAYGAEITGGGIGAAVGTFQYQLTEKEVVQGVLKYRKYPYLRTRAIVFTLIGILLLVESHYLRHSHSTGLVAFGCAMLVLGLSTFLYRPVTLRRYMTKAVRRNPVYTARKEVTFGESGLVVAAPNTRSEVTWAAFKKFTQDERFLYLHTDSAGTVMQLPKRALDAGTMENFLRCCQSVPRS